MKTLNKKIFTQVLGREDYINYFLFFASTDPVTARKRKRNRMVFVVIFLLIAGYFIVQDYERKKAVDWTFILIYLLLFAILYVVREYTERVRYKNYYTRYVDKSLKDSSEKHSTLEFSNSGIVIREDGNETPIPYTSFTEIAETPLYIYIKMEDGTALVIPKNSEYIDEIKENLNIISDEKKIAYTDMPNWKWK
ncbi:YcxB family protein [Weeksellaceae bacterium A-14]